MGIADAVGITVKYFDILYVQSHEDFMDECYDGACLST